MEMKNEEDTKVSNVNFLWQAASKLQNDNSSLLLPVISQMR